MPPRKRRRRAYIPPPPSPDQTTTAPRQPPEEEVKPPELTLPVPADLLPEIAAQSDFTTLVRLAACCKSLRREILRPAFIRRVCRERAAAVPPCALGFLHAYDKSRTAADPDQDQPPAPLFSAAHPATTTTPGVASFFERHLAPFAARTAGKSLLGDYEPLASRGGLVVLHRRYLGGDRCSDICVYDPMSGGRTFLPSPPVIRKRNYDYDRETKAPPVYGVSYTYALLTAAADGIGCSFRVLAADFTGLKAYNANIKVQTVSSDDDDAGYGGVWGPVTMVATHPRSQGSFLQPQCSAVVLCGTIHWLMYDNHSLNQFLNMQEPFHILTYDVSTAAAGSIELPKDGVPRHCKVSNLHLASSPDGRLSLHVANKFKISVWQLRPAGGDGWSLHAVIDVAMALRSRAPPDMPYDWWLKKAVEFASSGTARSGAILLRPFLSNWPTDNAEEEGEEGLAVLDMETEELRRHSYLNRTGDRTVKCSVHWFTGPIRLDRRFKRFN